MYCSVLYRRNVCQALYKAEFSKQGCVFLYFEKLYVFETTVFETLNLF